MQGTANTRARHNNNNDGKHILAVDDDPDIATLIKHYLHRNGFEVSAFIDPFVALEDFKVNCKTCKLIISDIRMSGMNGYEFVESERYG